MTITTILQIYKRPEYLQEQINAVLNQTLKSDKLIIVHNEGDAIFDNIVYPENTQFIYATPNMKFHLRFAIGLLMNTEYVAFFDDDTIPGENWYKNCIETISKHECICGTNGRIVDRENNTQIGVGWGTQNEIEKEVDFVGHAWFLRKKHLKYMWYDDTIEYNNGEDIQLSANAQIFGNIPTYVPPHPISDKTLWGSGKDAMKYGTDSVASYIVNPTHNVERYTLFHEYLQKGWKLVLEK